MSIAKRVPLIALLTCVLLLAIQPLAGGARRLTDDEVAQRAIDKMNATFNRDRTRIIGFGEGAVAKINDFQSRLIREATILKTANAARANIAKTQRTGNKALESEALKAVRELNKRNAGMNLIDDINNAKNTGLTGLQMVTDDCYAAINTALAD